jgi:hypothetical protein
MRNAFLNVAILIVAFGAPMRAQLQGQEVPGNRETQSIRSGSWSDPRVWSSGRVPQLPSRVRVCAGHRLDIDDVALTVRSLVVEKGAEIIVSHRFVFDTLDDIVIDGAITGVDGNPNHKDGAGLHLTAGKTALITGTVRSGNGLSPPKATAVGKALTTATANGESGGAGGQLEIRAITGSIVVSEDAHIASGHGGDGAEAEAFGGRTDRTGEDGGDAIAIGGNGGDAGILLMAAANGKGRIDIPRGARVLEPGTPGRGGSVVTKGGNGGPGTATQSSGVGGGTTGQGGNAANGWVVILGINTPDPASRAYFSFIQAHALPARWAAGTGGGSARGEAGKPGSAPTVKEH